MITNRIWSIALALGLAFPAWAGRSMADDTAKDGHPHKHCDCGEHRGEFYKKLLEKFDKDGDGKLNEEEREAAKAFVKEHRGEHKGEVREKLLEKFDKDGDGKLSDAEKEAAKEARKEHREERHDKRVEKFDKNGDGKINKDERPNGGNHKHHCGCKDKSGK